MIKVNFQIVIEFDDEVYYAHVPGVPGIVGRADTREEAITKLKKNVKEDLENLIANDSALPIGDQRSQNLRYSYTPTVTVTLDV